MSELKNWQSRSDEPMLKSWSLNVHRTPHRAKATFENIECLRVGDIFPLRLFRNDRLENRET